MLKNPFLNTGHYRIVQQYSRLQRTSRSISSPLTQMPSSPSSLQKFNSHHRGRITESHLFKSNALENSSASRRLNYQYFQSSPQTKYLDGPLQGSTFGSTSKYLKEIGNSNYFTKQLNYQITPTNHEYSGQNVKNQFNNASQKDFPSQRKQSSFLPKPRQQKSQKVNTNHKVQYYQYSCTNSKQSSHCQTKDRIKEASNVMEEQYSPRSSRPFIQNSQINIKTSTNLTQSLCSLNMKARPNRFSSIGDFQSRMQIEEKLPMLKKGPLRKRCSMAEQISKKYLQESQDEISGSKQLSSFSRDSKKSKQGGKLSNFYNQSPRAYVKARNKQDSRNPLQIIVRDKIFYLCEKLRKRK